MWTASTRGLTEATGLNAPTPGLNAENLDSSHHRSELRSRVLRLGNHSPEHDIVRPRLRRLGRRDRSLLVVRSAASRTDPRHQQLELVSVLRANFVGLES